jgi:hypothetical protein
MFYVLDLVHYFSSMEVWREDDIFMSKHVAMNVKSN